MIRTNNNNNNRMNPIRSFLRSFYVLVFCGTILSNTRVNTVRFASASTTSISSAVQALQTIDTRYFIAGGTCAAISHGITTPIDVIKTKIQSNPKKYSNRGLIGAAVDVINEDGLASLGNGLGPTVLGYGIEGALKFGIYEIMKQLFVELLSNEGSSKGLAFLLASIVAGGVAAIVLCPMESTRIKMVTDPSYAKLNLFTAFAKMTNEEGLLTSFAGIYAMLSKQVPYTFGKQVTFDVFASRLYTILDTIRDTNYGSLIPEGYRKWIVSIVAAFGASLVACIFSQPGDMILTETYHSSGGHSGGGGHGHSSVPTKVTKKPKKTKKLSSKVAAPPAPSQQHEQRSFVEIISSIYKNGGYPAFFTGTGARIVHVGLIITSQLVIYDIVKQLLGLPATGSH